MMRIRFVKTCWPFFFDSIATVPDREGKWFVNAGFATPMPEPVRKQPEPVADPVVFAPKLSTRSTKAKGKK